MIFSVWNQGGCCFDYFDDGKPQLTVNTEKPDHIQHRELGSTVEQAAWQLPAEARLVGHGHAPHGRIAMPAGQALGSDDNAMSSLKIGLLGLSALLAFKLLKGPRK